MMAGRSGSEVLFPSAAEGFSGFLPCAPNTQSEPNGLLPSYGLVGI